MQIKCGVIEVETARRAESFKEVAERAGISEATLKRARIGEGIRPEVAGRIAKALELPVEDIVIKWD